MMMNRFSIVMILGCFLFLGCSSNTVTPNPDSGLDANQVEDVNGTDPGSDPGTDAGADPGSDPGADETDGSEDAGNTDGDWLEDGGGDPGEPTDQGNPTDTDVPTRLECIEVCSGSGYCTPPTVCDGSRCVFDPATVHTCEVDNDCVPYSSFWDLGESCTTSQADCAHLYGDPNGTLLEACILVDGAGHCVRIPQHAADCANRNAEDIPWTDIEGNAVTVCGRENSYLCEEKACVPGCLEDADCSSSLRPKCDTASRKCACNSGSCASANYGSFCMADGTCGCNTSANCTPGSGFDTCYEGKCGCSSTAACQEMLPFLNVVCEPFGG